MTKADLRYAALMCGLMLAIAACTRAVALLPADGAAALLELAAFAQLAICVAAAALLARRDDADKPNDFMGLSSDPYQ